MTYGQGSLRVDRYEPGRPAEPACTTSSSTPACPPGRTLWRGRDLAGASRAYTAAVDDLARQALSWATI
jgi:hypothetical protein